jgi:hypothetical protein
MDKEREIQQGKNVADVAKVRRIFKPDRCQPSNFDRNKTFST